MVPAHCCSSSFSHCDSQGDGGGGGGGGGEHGGHIGRHKQGSQHGELLRRSWRTSIHVPLQDEPAGLCPHAKWVRSRSASAPRGCCSAQYARTSSNACLQQPQAVELRKRSSAGIVSFVEATMRLPSINAEVAAIAPLPQLENAAALFGT